MPLFAQPGAEMIIELQRDSGAFLEQHLACSLALRKNNHR
jgi:hypothetical protein